MNQGSNSSPQGETRDPEAKDFDGRGQTPPRLGVEHGKGGSSDPGGVVAFESTVLSDRKTSSATPLPFSDRLSGTVVDHFHIEKPIGRGGMGAVYAAHDRSLDRPVAIKVLPDELASEPDLEARFIREARAQARLASAHVVHIYHIGHLPPPPSAKDARPSLYFAMERVEGGALDAGLLKGQTLDAETARKLMIEVAKGLTDALVTGIIHRDIKPQNLLRTRDGHVKIADFGLAKPLDGGDVAITREGALVGSPLYIAPEQAKGEDVDHRADMYALGGTFFHLLAGRPPFDGATAVGVIAKHLSEPVPDLVKLAPRVPEPLAKIVVRLLAKKPEGRFATYAELIEALENAAPNAMPPAGFAARGASLAIDFLLASVLVGFFAIFNIGWVGIAVNVAYVNWAHATGGQTLAKYLFRLRVVGTHGGPLGWKKACARTAMSMWLPIWIGVLTLATAGIGTLRASMERMQPGEFDSLKAFVVASAVGNVLLSIAYLGGFAMAAIHVEKRALHDLVSGSKVVYKLQR